MLDTVLLNTIEKEISHSKDKIFEKVIPMEQYSYETKKTLDVIIEKYGGLIKRYKDKVIIYVKPNNTNNTLKFSSINKSLNNLDKRLTIVENKLNQIIDDEISKNKSLNTYLEYFRCDKEKEQIHKLIEEIINHR